LMRFTTIKLELVSPVVTALKKYLVNYLIILNE